MLDLVDPDTGAVTAIDGFSKTNDYSGGHDDGATSVDEGEGWLFVTNRTTGSLDIVDPVARTIVARTTLATTPDYVRYVAATHEVWVSEPSGSQIEILALTATAGTAPSLKRVATMPIENGPESLVIDQARGRAYTHHWQTSTLGIDVRTRAIPALAQRLRRLARDRRRAGARLGARGVQRRNAHCPRSGRQRAHRLRDRRRRRLRRHGVRANHEARVPRRRCLRMPHRSRSRARGRARCSRPLRRAVRHALRRRGRPRARVGLRAFGGRPSPGERSLPVMGRCAVNARHVLAGLGLSLVVISMTVPASAQDAASLPRERAPRLVDLGARIAYARPLGAFDAGTHARDGSFGGIPFALDATVRLSGDARWSVAGGLFVS